MEKETEEEVTTVNYYLFKKEGKQNVLANVLNPEKAKAISESFEEGFNESFMCLKVEVFRNDN